MLKHQRPRKAPYIALRDAVRRYFGFSRRETSGFAVLLLLLVLWLVLPQLLRPALPHYDPKADQRQLDALAAELAAARQPRIYASRYPRRKAPQPAVAQVALAPFDPNALSATDWEARGVPRYVAQRMVKYRDIIRGFKAKAQIRRTYGLADSVYARLAPYMRLPDELPVRAAYATSKNRYPERSAPFPASKFPRKPTNLAPFDLNAADTTQLMQIRGIGRGLSGRVVAYRARLGGFSREEQLGEIYNLPPDLVDSLRKYTFVAAGFAPTPIDVNNATLAELKDHPYVGLRLGRVLVAYRQQHGPYQQATDLRKIRILDDATFEKLQPYLRF
ncbi:hypothetical protein SAMN00120144_2928 [Hymenobacter roseosalivarius DSM 11622]|uniref:Helix-hairpin-helix domain-containing protein n=1 Tax=Hymenobacter roseosalivarius DSM 11622 TaxID=645990 RepID=A0A1W1VVD6_9BACT|nr:helix-hairpin-helix domain-containing protein [Hymenobacter roseosalivarius]SMB96824.1 hypothetical protein SAMN00120144_2928 [Hymenobacter roseosalivarius DSM 11622]